MKATNMKNMNKIKNILALLGVIVCLLSASSTFAMDDPKKLLENVTQQMIGKLEDSRQGAKHNLDHIYHYVNEIVLPHVDFIEMARWVVGRNAWNAANEGIKREFVDQFKTLIIRHYAQFLLKFSGQEIKFYPLRKAIGDQKQVQISSVIKNNNDSPIHIDYALILRNGNWKIYDMVIEKSSLIEGYQAQFANDIQRGGIAAAINKIRRLNNPRR